MLRKKIITAMSLSPRKFFGVLGEKSLHVLMKITGASIFNAYLDKKNLLTAIKNPQWAVVSDEQFSRFRPLWTIEEVREIAQQVSKKEIADTVDYANKICEHKFDLLGSGFVSLGREIDWQRDFVSGRVWPYVFAKDSFIIDLEDNSDIKIPWELSRHQFFTALGQAYVYTGDENYALEFKQQVEHWIDHNAYKVGVNWMCSMDIGIRAISWVWARTFFEQSPSIDKPFWRKFHQVLALHGDYVYNNIEDWGGIKNNHYLSNGTALYILGLALPDLPNASKWKQKGRDILEECCEKQILSDGVDYEMSTSYHRLVFEFLLTPYLFAGKYGEHFSAGYQQKLKKMLDFVAAYTKPDGSIALFGDGDNGRCQVLSEYCREHISNHRYLLCIGAVLFNEGTLKADAHQFFDEALWLCGPSSKEVFNSLEGKAHSGSRAFDKGGFFLLEQDNVWCLVDCGPRGIPGAVGVHGHNDVTSFELSLCGESVIVDSGMYTYSGDPKISFNMKSTKGHNLLIIDNEEISTTPFDLWVIGDEAQPIIFGTDFSGEKSVLEIGHLGYSRLEKSVQKVSRKITSQNDFLEICDRAEGSVGDDHSIEIRLHTPLTPTIQNKDFVLEGERYNFRIALSDCDLQPFVEDALLAESYGKMRTKGYAIGWRGERRKMPWSGRYQFSFEGK